MKKMLFPVLLLAGFTTSIAASQQARFDDVVRNLRNPDAKIRLSAVRLLREARYPESIVPMAPLVNDPVDQIQLEAIAAELSFFLVEPIPERTRLGFLIEVRNRGGARGAFELGPLAVWPRPAPMELLTGLVTAIDDENGRVRLEAIYAIGVVGTAPLPAEIEQGVTKALDHYDQAVREAAARVAGRHKATGAAPMLMKAINDSSAGVRYAAMRAIGELRDETAVQALTEQLNYYSKGEGAGAALDALARIAHPSSIEVFRARLTDKDHNLRRAAADGVGRAGDKASVATLESGIGMDPSEPVRAAMAFALQKLGGNYIPRLVNSMDDRKMVPQIQSYLLELGPPIEKELIPLLQESDETIRAGIVEVLGEVGGEASLAALKGLQDRDKDVMEAARHAIERIQLRKP